MGYLIFRGYGTEGAPLSSLNVLKNVYVSEMPSHKKAAQRMTEYYVKGRDGALHVNEGYANVDIKAVLILLDAGADARQTVNAWADGTGRLITSDDLTKAYKATVKDEVKWKRVKAHGYIEPFQETKVYSIGSIVRHSGGTYRFTQTHDAGPWSASDVEEIFYAVNGLYDTATITFNCDPYMYEATESTVELTATGQIVNVGTADAYPLIKVEGSGNASFTFNGTEIEIDGMTSGVPVYIDCENGYVYTASGAATMRGEIPKLGLNAEALGANVITFGSNVSKITVTPKWRWI